MTAFSLSPGGKQDEIPRFRKMMEDCIRPDVLWNEIKDNKDIFSTDLNFDGGFCLKAIISKDCKFSEFEKKGVENVTECFRKIRNVLAHGRDQQTEGTIAPTKHNLHRIRPWLHLIQAATGEVVLYRDADEIG